MITEQESIEKESVEKLRLECEFFLISGKKDKALEIYDKILAIAPDPFVYTAKAKLLETLFDDSRSVENFEKALDLTENNPQDREEIVRLILELEKDRAGILRNILRVNVLQKEGIEKEDTPVVANFAPILSPHPPILESQNLEKTEMDLKNSEMQELENAYKTDHLAGEHKKSGKEDIFPSDYEKTEMDLKTPAPSSDKENIPSHASPDDIPTSFYRSQPDLDKTEVVHGESSDDSSQKIEKHKSYPKNAYCPTMCQAQSDSQKIKKWGDGEVKRLGRYKIIKKIGEGGMGVVYKVYDIELDRTVAMKVIIGNDAMDSVQAQRFMQEVKATARLHHPNIVSIYDFGDVPQHYFTMEYVEGKTLSQKIKEEMFQCRRAAQILKSICEAIHCAHKAKIIHRDLKPSNIMIEESGNVKVMDFGLAKFMESETGVSRTGDILGTPSYMSPEQASGSVVDERSDIYSIGAIGYEMITGRPVFKGDNVFNILHQVSNQEPTHPKSINANIEKDLETIVLKCLEKSPGKRYANVSDLTEDLARYMENRPILAQPPTLLARFIKWLKRNKEMSIAVSAVVMSIIGVFLFLLFEMNQKIRSIQAYNIVHDTFRWNKEMISYEEEIQPQFEKAISLSPSFIIYRQWGYYCLQYAHFQGKQKNLSEEEYQEAQCRQQYFYEEAEKKFVRALELNPHDYSSIYYLSLVAGSLGNMEKHKKYTLELLHVVEKFKLENEFKYVLTTLEALKKKDYDGAIQSLERALRYNSELFCAYNGLGEIYIKKQEYDKAAAYLEKSLEIAPLYYPALFNQAKLYLLLREESQKLKEYARADTYLLKAQSNVEKSIVLAPAQDVYHKPGEIYYVAGKVYSWQHNPKKAEEFFKIAKKLGFPEFEKEYASEEK